MITRDFDRSQPFRARGGVTSGGLDEGEPGAGSGAAWIAPLHISHNRLVRRKYTRTRRSAVMKKGVRSGRTESRT